MKYITNKKMQDLLTILQDNSTGFKIEGSIFILDTDSSSKELHCKENIHSCYFNLDTKAYAVKNYNLNKKEYNILELSIYSFIEQERWKG